MKKHIKQLAAIYTAAIITGIFAFTYISHGITALAVQAVPVYTITTTPADGQQMQVVGPNIQPADVYSTYILQPDYNTIQTPDVNPQSDNTGGLGHDYEVQPALGYGALNWTMQ